MMELKSKTGDRSEGALYQTIDGIIGALECLIDVYVVIPRGTTRRFFEYHNNKMIRDHNDIDETND